MPAALGLFTQMEREGVAPNRITYNVLLAACDSSGKVKLGYFGISGYFGNCDLAGAVFQELSLAKSRALSSFLPTTLVRRSRREIGALSGATREC